MDELDDIEREIVANDVAPVGRSLQSPLGGNISKPITSETTYTLTCIDLNGNSLTKKATVRIIPTFQES